MGESLAPVLLPPRGAARVFTRSSHASVRLTSNLTGGARGKAHIAPDVVAWEHLALKSERPWSAAHFASGRMWPASTPQYPRLAHAPARTRNSGAPISRAPRASTVRHNASFCSSRISVMASLGRGSPLAQNVEDLRRLYLLLPLLPQHRNRG